MEEGVTFHIQIGEREIHEQIRATDEGKTVVRSFSGEGSIHVLQLDEFVPLDLGDTPETLVQLTWGEIDPGSVSWDNTKPKRRWPESVTTKTRRGAESQGTLTRDDLPLPNPNPWRRNVRFADMAFFPDGRAALCTFDGDIWILDDPTADTLVWHRFASGFHEPKSLVIRDNQLYVFDRSGIWRVDDSDGNGEAEEYEMFCNLFSQTAETREFAMDMELAPDGSFVIAKGGQSSSTVNKHGGRILRIAPDGLSFTELGWGFRQPYLGVDSESGIVTVSDQQGHWTPTTPIHFLRQNGYHGFRSNALGPKGPPLAEKILEPDLWIPHPVNQSGASQVWARNSKLGPLADQLLHVGYMKPDLFVIPRDSSGALQAAISRIWENLPAPPLSGSIGPDGNLYLTGFKIWGTVSEQISALTRIRFDPEAGPHSVPTAFQATAQGVWLEFAHTLDPDSIARPDSWFVERWNYRRTADYGSPHYKLDGTPGQEIMALASAHLSEDGRSVFLAIPDMKRCHTLSLRYQLQSTKGVALNSAVFLTVNHLGDFDPAANGFGDLKIDLSARMKTPNQAEIQPSPAEGAKIARHFGCLGCHSVTGKDRHKLGPEWNGLMGSNRTLVDGSKAKVDAAYLWESITDPTARVAKGFDKEGIGMPNYLGILNKAQIESLVLYIGSLK